MLTSITVTTMGDRDRVSILMLVKATMDRTGSNIIIIMCGINKTMTIKLLTYFEIIELKLYNYFN